MSKIEVTSAAPRVGQMRRTISRSGVALEAWTGAEWLRLKVLSMQEHWIDPMAAPGCLIIDLRVEALDVDLENLPSETGVCKKCIKNDMVDGYGRCTNCAEPSATEDDIQMAAKEFIEGRRND